MVKKTLYLGTDPSHYITENLIIHYPVIKIIPCMKASITPHLAHWECFTHLIFTSKNAVTIFESFKMDYRNKVVIAIGSVTAATLEKYNYSPHWIAKEETQEGLIELLRTKDLKDAHFFFPRSTRSRPVLLNYFKREGISHTVIDLYDTQFQKLDPFPDLNNIDEIVFTSPSTVEAFYEIFPHIPKHIKIIPIGSITASCMSILYLDSKLSNILSSFS